MQNTFILSKEQINVIIESLKKMPREFSNDTIVNIIKQTNMQSQDKLEENQPKNQ